MYYSKILIAGAEQVQCRIFYCSATIFVKPLKRAASINRLFFNKLANMLRKILVCTITRTKEVIFKHFLSVLFKFFQLFLKYFRRERIN